MFMQTVNGPPCARCGAALGDENYACTACGKTDLPALRRSLSRAALQFVVIGTLAFGGFAVATAYFNGPRWLAALTQSIDGPFNPRSVAKK